MSVYCANCHYDLEDDDEGCAKSNCSVKSTRYVANLQAELKTEGEKYESLADEYDRALKRVRELESMAKKIMFAERPLAYYNYSEAVDICWQHMRGRGGVDNES